MAPPKTITFFKEHTDLQHLTVASPKIKTFFLELTFFDSPKNEKVAPLNKMTTFFRGYKNT